jgi:hypothetical protein
MRHLALVAAAALLTLAIAVVLPGTAKANLANCTDSSVFCGWKDHGFTNTKWEWGVSAPPANFACPLATWCFFADAPNDQLSSAYNNRSSANKYDTLLGKDRVIGGGLTYCFKWNTAYSDFNDIGFNDVASSIYLATSSSLC